MIETSFVLIHIFNAISAILNRFTDKVLFHLFSPVLLHKNSIVRNKITLKCIALIYLLSERVGHIVRAFSNPEGAAHPVWRGTIKIFLVIVLAQGAKPLITEKYQGVTLI